MNSIEITRTNGNIPKALPNNDHISGVAVTTEDDFQAILISSADDKALVGVIDELKGSDANLGDFCENFFAMNPGASLYVGVGANAVEKLQKYAKGEIRQMAVFNNEGDINEVIVELATTAKSLEEENMPLSLIVNVTPSVTIDGLLALDEVRASGRERISVVIGCDEKGTGVFESLGTVLGAISAAAVNESISWVRKFPTNIVAPSIANTSITQINSAVLDTLDQAGFIFYRTYTGLGGVYISDSHTMDLATSDYNTIEAVRTMDKAVRGIRTYLLPELGSPLTLDPETGYLAPETVKHLETVASQQLTAMEKAGEISGWSVEIDPAQNVLATSTVEFVIKNVPIGVMRKASVKIGYAQSV